MNRTVTCRLSHVLCSHTYDHLTSRSTLVPSTVPYVTGTLVLIPLLYVAGTPVPNNLLQMKEGILVTNLLIYIIGTLDPNSVLYTTGRVISKIPFKVYFQQF